MKKYLVIVMSILLIGFYSCRSRINQMHEPVNSTASGDYSTATNGHDQGDTLYPTQPDALDTSGEQTGRMNRTLGTIQVPAASENSGKTDMKK